MEYQLRDYRVKPGEIDEFIKEWKEKLYPLRVKKNFKLIGAWIVNGENRFVWILGYEGSFEKAEKDYYDSPERKAISPDPARHLENPQHFQMSSVL
jgi:hypothetical protein